MLAWPDDIVKHSATAGDSSRYPEPTREQEPANRPLIPLATELRLKLRLARLARTETRQQYHWHTVTQPYGLETRPEYPAPGMDQRYALRPNTFSLGHYSPLSPVSMADGLSIATHLLPSKGPPRSCQAVEAFESSGFKESRLAIAIEQATFLHFELASLRFC